MALPIDLQCAYELLNVNPSDDLQTVKASYRKLALQHHPDKNRDDDGEKFKAISTAYEVICKHVKGQDDVDLEDPDFQVLFELFHLFSFIGSQHVADASQGYASGGSSCEGEDDDDDDEMDDTDSDADHGYTDGDDEEDEGTEGRDNSSEGEPETPANELGRSGFDFEGQVCNGDHGHGACRHNFGVALPRPPIWSSASDIIKPEDLELLKKTELQTRLAGGKKRVETDRERKIRVKLLLVEQQIAQERKEAEAKEKKEAARLAREQEKQEAAARRAEKNARKRAAAQEKADLAKKASLERLLSAQKDRSAVFDQLTSCAKVHDDKAYYAACNALKQTIIEKNVNVAGWERLPELSAEDLGEDAHSMRETTLLHLAVQASDPELVSWLCNRGARADARDSAGYTPLHRALENGDTRMLDYFFEAFPPYDSEGEENRLDMKVYEPAKKDDPATSLVMLATLSGDAEVIDYVLDRSTVEEVEHCYRYAQTQIRQAHHHKSTISAWKSVQQMLAQKEGFTPASGYAARTHGPQHYVSRLTKNGHYNKANAVNSRQAPAGKAKAAMLAQS